MTTIGYVFQGFNLVPVLSALENVMLPLQIKGASSKEAKEKALYRLQEVGLTEFMHNRPSKMSGGQQQRVAIARALVNGPSLVIADEPTANLDSETARMIISIMRDLNEKDAITFIFSTHDQRLLDRVKRLIRLEDGRIIDGGTPMMKWMRLALRNILRNKRRSLVTLLAIAVGFAAISLFRGYASSMYSGLKTMAIRGEGLGHLTIFKEGWLEKGKLDPEKYMFSKAEIEKISKLVTERKRGCPRNTSD